MSTLSTRLLTLLGAGILLTVATLTSSSSGVQSGGAFPANCASQLPSCTACHGGSTPSASGPTTTLQVVNNRRALALGETVAVTTTVTGGVAGSTGGFVCETTAGTFAASNATAQVIGNPAGITHVGNSLRSWTYLFTAPATSGPVDLTSAGLATDGTGTGGDRMSFTGFNRAATSATPVRLYALPNSVFNIGSGCPDGYGNFAVLGANGTPTIGNSGFALRLLGASPGQVAIVWVGFNPPGFVSASLTPAGFPGCWGHLGSITASLTAVISGSAANTNAVQRAEGAATMPLPIPNNPSLQGVSFHVQGGYLDPSVAAVRALPLSFTNGLRIAIP